MDTEELTCEHGKLRLLCKVCKKKLQIEQAARATGTGEQMTFAQMLKHCEVTELYHITRIENLPSITENGLLCREALSDQGIEFGDISMEGPQRWREEKGLHSYVPLYFNVRNPMMWKRRFQVNDLCVLGVDATILERETVIVTTGNAASRIRKSEHYKGWWNLRRLDWRIIWADRWTDYKDGKRIRCAEALVPDRIAPQWIHTVYVGSIKAEAKVNTTITPARIIKNNRLFFTDRYRP